MKLPLQVVFRDFPPSDAVEAAIGEKAEKLDLFSDRITGCRVTVGFVKKHQRQGKLYSIRVDLTVPGSEIVVTRDKAEDIYVAIRDAFGHAKRKLEDYARHQRGDVKIHEAESHGRIVRLFGNAGYGFIEKPNGSDLYFHRYNVVHPDFDRLEVGDEVTFQEETAGEGLQANHVSARKH